MKTEKARNFIFKFFLYFDELNIKILNFFHDEIIFKINEKTINGKKELQEWVIIHLQTSLNQISFNFQMSKLFIIPLTTY
jgi:hypothetical protein